MSGIEINIEKVGEDVLSTFTEESGRSITVRLRVDDAAEYGRNLMTVALIGGSVVTDETLAREFPPETLPCCNVIEHDEGSTPECPQGAHRCPGTSTRRWRVYVCDTCGAQCGVLAHPNCDTGPDV